MPNAQFFGIATVNIRTGVLPHEGLLGTENTELSRAFLMHDAIAQWPGNQLFNCPEWLPTNVFDSIRFVIVRPQHIRQGLLLYELCNLPKVQQVIFRLRQRCSQIVSLGLEATLLQMVLCEPP